MSRTKRYRKVPFAGRRTCFTALVHCSDSARTHIVGKEVRVQLTAICCSWFCPPPGRQAPQNLDFRRRGETLFNLRFWICDFRVQRLLENVKDVAAHGDLKFEISDL